VSVTICPPACLHWRRLWGACPSQTHRAHRESRHPLRVGLRRPRRGIALQQRRPPMVVVGALQPPICGSPTLHLRVRRRITNAQHRTSGAESAAPSAVKAYRRRPGSRSDAWKAYAPCHNDASTTPVELPAARGVHFAYPYHARLSISLVSVRRHVARRLPNHDWPRRCLLSAAQRAQLKQERFDLFVRMHLLGCRVTIQDPSAPGIKPDETKARRRFVIQHPRGASLQSRR